MMRVTPLVTAIVNFCDCLVIARMSRSRKLRGGNCGELGRIVIVKFDAVDG